MALHWSHWTLPKNIHHPGQRFSTWWGRWGGLGAENSGLGKARSQGWKYSAFGWVTHLHPPAPCAVLYLCALQGCVYWTCLSGIRQRAFWREGPHHTHLCVFSPDSSEVSAPWTCWMNGNLWSAFRDRLLFTSIFLNYRLQVVVFCVCTSQHRTSRAHKQHLLQNQPERIPSAQLCKLQNGTLSIMYCQDFQTRGSYSRIWDHHLLSI